MSDEIDELLDAVTEAKCSQITLKEDPNFLKPSQKSDSPHLQLHLSDSSDDEDCREHTQKYNEYGRDINHMLKTKPPQITSSKPAKTAAASQPKPFFSDLTSGIRIINPLIAYNSLTAMLIGKQVVKLSDLKRFTMDLKQQNESNWIVSGVVVGKMTKTSQNGNQFTLWTLSDLQADLKTFTVFLFGSANKELWKCSMGTAVSLLNAKILEKKDGSKAEATLSVDNVQKVLLLGQSKDYALCKSMKKDGQCCGQFVNRNRCEFCPYHIRQEYQKSSSKRMDLQSSFSRMQSLRQKILGSAAATKKPLSAQPFNHQQQMLVPSKASSSLRQKDASLLEKLSGRVSATNTTPSLATPSKASKVNATPSVVTPIKVDNLGAATSATANVNDVAMETKQTANTASMSTKETLVANSASSMKVAALTVTKEMPNRSAPILSCLNNVVDLSVNVSAKRKAQAKMRALQWVQKNGPIAKDDPNKLKKCDKNATVAKKRTLEQQSGHESEVLNEGSAKRQKVELSERYRKIMAATSAHAESLQKLDDRKVVEHFDRLELKERLEEKMQQTYKISCKAVTCLQCKYTSFSAHERCKAERHKLSVKDATKRFFKCSKCGNRNVTLDVYPTKGCGKCGSFKWERTGMMKEKKVDLGSQLSVRGGEQKFLGSDLKNASLDLMMPFDE